MKFLTDMNKREYRELSNHMASFIENVHEYIGNIELKDQAGNVLGSEWAFSNIGIWYDDDEEGEPEISLVMRHKVSGDLRTISPPRIMLDDSTWFRKKK